MPFVGFNEILGKKTLGVDVIDNPKKYKWSCPHCKGKLSHTKEHIRRGRFQVVEHFRHKNECPYPTERDTLTHLQMKRWVFDSFKNIYPNIQMEQRIGNHITDVAIREEIEIKDGTRWNDFAIECQASPITTVEIMNRMYEYTNHNFYTLWILHSDFLEPTMGMICDKEETSNGFWETIYTEVVDNLYKFREFMKTLHVLYQYRIFFLNPEESQFFVVRFTGRRWETKKYITIGNVTSLKLLNYINSEENLKIASLYHEKVKGRFSGRYIEQTN